ncbi:Coenzyme F420 hydrogenase/dehydrogenase, beta subunit C-terminal domain [Massilimicrobiota sp. SW1139]|uniref:Coenzyme F420 hydrogenase/dehydrogenase, beta subunit C-terminal domain n=1 Tax=Massilimicrobiota sp. SW1139 TaxID=2530043 RepID=UPI00143BB59C|nr:Coenzyme F420 hydrogenase/dehydrogenase, beta subunit C-terminal domain [Massilimicrobiota sp. SW1139]NJE43786.1 4Fe-4S dicluster domain-containing protein [Massilimicrobiota sp. SW1139]
MINANQYNCTGCGACKLSCPTKCIEMIPDDEGFLIPKINKVKCIDCNICERVCPEINTLENKNKGKVYAFYNKDSEMREKSSSGGFFYSIAEYVISQNGIVCGAIFDSQMKVIHACSNSIDDVKKMMKSKYVQSDTRETFKEIKKYLEINYIVLFCGTPCQVGGLKKYLKKDYTNLITIQLICHGVPSPLLFEKYKEYLIKRFSLKKISEFSFRDNNKFIMSISDGEKRKKWQGNTDRYLRPFIKGKNYRMCCYSCKYSQNHISDFTIGDFWGLEHYYENFCDGKGISFVMINSNKGKEIFYELNSETIEATYNLASKHNKNLLNPSPLDKDRRDFYKNINDSNYIENLKKYIPLSAKIVSKLPENIIKKISSILYHE